MSEENERLERLEAVVAELADVVWQNFPTVRASKPIAAFVNANRDRLRDEEAVQLAEQRAAALAAAGAGR